MEERTTSEPMLSPDVDPGEADLAEIGAALRRRLALIVVTTLVALGLALAYLAVTTPKYLATTSILIDARVRAPLGSEGQAPPNAPDLTLIDSQIKVIASESVLRRVVVAERLDRDPEFAPTTPGLRTRLMQMIGLGPKPSPGDADLTLRAIMSLGEAVSVRRSERTYVLDIDVLTQEPDKSARLANAIAQAYLDDLGIARQETARRNADTLRARLNELRAKVEDSERKIVAERAASGLFDANGKTVNGSDLGEVGQQITAARARAAEARTRYEQTRRLAGEGMTPDGLIEATKSAVLEKLRTQLAELLLREANYSKTLGPLHPAFIELRQQVADTRRLIRAESSRLVEVARADWMSARAQEQAALGRLGGSKDRAENDEKAMVRLRDLEREAAAARAAYERFLKASETVVEDTPGAIAARVISPATPPLSAASPKKIATLAIALASGLGLGVATALALDFLAAARRRALGRPASAPAARERVAATARPRRRARRDDAETDAAIAADDERRDRYEDQYDDHQQDPDEDRNDDAPAPRGARFADSRMRAPARELAPVWLDLAAFEDDPFADALGADEATRMREEVKIWRLLDAAGADVEGGLGAIGLVDASGRPRDGLSTRLAVALARAAAARGDRVLVLPARGSLALDALLAGGPARAVEVDGEARLVAPVPDPTGRVHIAAPPDVAPTRAEARRSLGEAREAFDILIADGAARGLARADLCAESDVVFAVAHARDPAARLAEARDAIEAAGGVFGGALLVGRQPRRPGARDAA